MPELFTPIGESDLDLSTSGPEFQDLAAEILRDLPPELDGYDLQLVELAVAVKDLEAATAALNAEDVEASLAADLATQDTLLDDQAAFVTDLAAGDQVLHALDELEGTPAPTATIETGPTGGGGDSGTCPPGEIRLPDGSCGQPLIQ